MGTCSGLEGSAGLLHEVKAVGVIEFLNAVAEHCSGHGRVAGFLTLCALFLLLSVVNAVYGIRSTFRVLLRFLYR